MFHGGCYEKNTWGFRLQICMVKVIVFPVVMCRCESWTIKKVECWRIEAFKLWCWRGLLKVTFTMRSNWSILKEINPEYSLEGLMLKLKLQYFGHLMWRTDSLEKTLMLGKVEGRRRRGRQRMRWLDSITHWTWVWANSRRQWRTGRPGLRQSMGSPRVGHDWGTEQQHCWCKAQGRFSGEVRLQEQPYFEWFIASKAQRRVVDNGPAFMYVQRPHP